MPNKRSAMKRMKTDDAKRVQNSAVKRRARTARRRVLEAVNEGNKSAGTERLNAYYHELDKAVKRGVVNANTAARQKSRCAARVAALS